MPGANPANRVADIATSWARAQPRAVAVIDDRGAWTYSELQQHIERAALWLRERGVGPGDRVVLAGDNCRTFLALYLAAARLDAWPVLLHANQIPADVEHIRAHAGARCVIHVSAAGKGQRAAASAELHEVGELGPVWISSIDSAARPEPVPTDPAERVAAVIYTSGSEGEPKGVMLANRNLLFTAKVSGDLRRLAPGERMYAVLPMSHSLGLSVVTLGTLYHGATLRQTSRFDPMAVAGALEREGISVLIGMPMMYRLLAEFSRRKGIARLIAPALRVISVAGAPLTADVKAEAEALFGLVLHNGYGITECSPTISQTRLEAPRRDCSVGPVWPDIEVRIDKSHEEDTGEVFVRGPNVMKGYYRNPNLTAAVLDRQGWFRTGDLGRIDAHGNLFIAGRAGELIIRFGYKVMPAEIEAVLERHPDVARSAIIAGSGGRDEIIAFIQPAPSRPVRETDLAAWCASHLPPQKRPSRFVLVAALPVTSTGKIRKAELHQMGLR